MKRLILHIGLHKTGTTSLQKFFLEHRNFYIDRDINYYVSATRPNNGSEVAYLILRDGLPPRNEDFEPIIKHVTAFLQDTVQSTGLIIGEAFSYLRTDAECQAIRDLLSEKIENIEIVIVWREKSEWWKSYLNQMQKDGSRGPCPAGETSYLDPHGWLTDFGLLRDVLFRNFENVIELEYKQNMIRHFCTSLKLPLPPTYVEHRANTRANIFVRNIREAPKLLYARYLSRGIIGRAKRRFFPSRAQGKKSNFP